MNEPVVEITRRGAERLRQGHLWIYRGDVAKAPGATAGDAVAVVDGPQPCLGFAIRDVGRRLAADGRAPRQLPRSVEQLTGLVGRLPLLSVVLGQAYELAVHGLDLVPLGAPPVPGVRVRTRCRGTGSAA